MQDLIYGKAGLGSVESETKLEIDTIRYDVNPLRLQQFKQKPYKRLLKKKFITGQAKDKILQNLLNMSDSDEEGKDKEGKTIDKEQLKKIEGNAIKGTKQDKKRKRMENKGIKVDTDSDENSEDIEDASGDEDLSGKKKEKKEEEVKHKDVKKSDDEIRKGMFLGEKYGHYKIGTYV